MASDTNWTAGKATFYKSGDPTVGGVTLHVGTHNYRNVDTLLDDLSQKMPALNYGARRIYTIGGRTEITSIDALKKHGSDYVCTDKTKPGTVLSTDLKKVNYYESRRKGRLKFGQIDYTDPGRLSLKGLHSVNGSTSVQSTRSLPPLESVVRPDLPLRRSVGEIRERKSDKKLKLPDINRGDLQAKGTVVDITKRRQKLAKKEVETNQSSRIVTESKRSSQRGSAVTQTIQHWSAENEVITKRDSAIRTQDNPTIYNSTQLQQDGTQNAENETHERKENVVATKTNEVIRTTTAVVTTNINGELKYGSSSSADSDSFERRRPYTRELDVVDNQISGHIADGVSPEQDRVKSGQSKREQAVTQTAQTQGSTHDVSIAEARSDSSNGVSQSMLRAELLLKERSKDGGGDSLEAGTQNRTSAERRLFAAQSDEKERKERSLETDVEHSKAGGADQNRVANSTSNDISQSAATKVARQRKTHSEERTGQVIQTGSTNVQNDASSQKEAHNNEVTQIVSTINSAHSTVENHEATARTENNKAAIKSNSANAEMYHEENDTQLQIHSERERNALLVSNALEDHQAAISANHVERTSVGSTESDRLLVMRMAEDYINSIENVSSSTVTDAKIFVGRSDSSRVMSRSNFNAKTSSRKEEHREEVRNYHKIQSSRSDDVGDDESRVITLRGDLTGTNIIIQPHPRASMRLKIINTT